MILTEKTIRADDIRTTHGWYRREIAQPGGMVVHLYCGDTDTEWTTLGGSPDQADIDAECQSAIREAAQRARAG